MKTKNKFFYLLCFLFVFFMKTAHAEGDNFVNPWEDWGVNDGNCDGEYEGKWKDYVENRPSSYVESQDTIYIYDTEAFVWFMKVCNGIGGSAPTNMNGETVNIMCRHINLCGRYWSPITEFAGTIVSTNQDTVIISGLRTKLEDYVSKTGALFSKNSGNISNLHLTNIIIEETTKNLLYATLVGENSGRIKNCSGNATINVVTPEPGGNTKIGVLVANNDGAIEYCSSYGSIYANFYGVGYTETGVGGIAGSSKGLINACTNHAIVVANGFGVGGIAGNAKKTINCANLNFVSGIGRFGSNGNALYRGGLLGVVNDTLANSFNIAYTEGFSLVGEGDGNTVINCYKISPNPSMTDTYRFSYIYYLTDSIQAANVYHGNYGFTKNEENRFVLEKESLGEQELVNALNAWVAKQNNNDYLFWTSDNGGNYPYLTSTTPPATPTTPTKPTETITSCEELQDLLSFTWTTATCKGDTFDVVGHSNIAFDSCECLVSINGNHYYGRYYNDTTLRLSVPIPFTEKTQVTALVNVGKCYSLIKDSVSCRNTNITPFVMKGWNDVVAISNADNVFTSYQWYRDGTELKGEKGQYFYEPGGLTAGKYHIKIWRNDGYSFLSCPITIGTELKSKEKKPQIEIYPNPAREKDPINISLKNTDSAKIDNLQIVDNTGNVVLNIENMSEEQKFSLYAGFYIVYMRLKNGEIISNKLVVTK